MNKKIKIDCMTNKEILVKEIKQHQKNVGDNLNRIIQILHFHAERHDRSKFMPEEFDLLLELKKRNAGKTPAAFGTPEYDEIKETLLEPMLKSHYKRNDHHPEHFENGINDMDLIQLTELICDIQDASKRSGQTEWNLDAYCEKYGIGDQLKGILVNTKKRMGW